MSRVYAVTEYNGRMWTVYARTNTSLCYIATSDVLSIALHNAAHAARLEVTK